MSVPADRPARPIAIIGGTGPAGMGLALRWVRAGETVIVGSREENRAVQAAASIKGRVGETARISGMENSAACAAADILMLTVPFAGQASLIKRLKPSITILIALILRPFTVSEASSIVPCALTESSASIGISVLLKSPPLLLSPPSFFSPSPAGAR